MNIQSFTEKVVELVGKDDLKSAISLLYQLLKNNPKLDDVIMQSSQLNDIMRQIRNGVVSFEDASITKNKIRMAILSLVSEIEENVLTRNELQDEINAKNETDYKSTNQLFHFGTGDNIGGNKIIIS